MSWRCSSTSNEGLIANLLRHGLIKNDAVDRAHFCPTMPYEDSPQRIGYDATISGISAKDSKHAAEALLGRLGPGKRVLDIGSGSGYLTAVLARLVTPGGTVVGIEHIQQLCDLSIENLKKDPVHCGMLQDGTIRIIRGDGRLGYPEGGPYDAIHVGAAASTMHQTLIDQLKAPGRMFIPVDGGFSQYIWRVDKDEEGNVKKEKQYGVMYVPLTDARDFRDED
ncbi:protein-L-isoaspartate O-methyltransferase [Choiromyces venosus 120613-1]|uniref:Protein-L-isoaspartate O-methyltransferase n=1 Tax=Choiromyces venosus 120613-1 TaxID=1336337 RepID=A0A3N4JA21_9PEZI|nr:protein-L-isoaspartate O-methyltransferase [Choiromyces venosus 120613-1]